MNGQVELNHGIRGTKRRQVRWGATKNSVVGTHIVNNDVQKIYMDVQLTLGQTSTTTLRGAKDRGARGAENHGLGVREDGGTARISGEKAIQLLISREQKEYIRFQSVNEHEKYEVNRNGARPRGTAERMTNVSGSRYYIGSRYQDIILHNRIPIMERNKRDT